MRERVDNLVVLLGKRFSAMLIRFATCVPFSYSTGTRNTQYFIQICYLQPLYLLDQYTQHALRSLLLPLHNALRQLLCGQPVQQ